MLESASKDAQSPSFTLPSFLPWSGPMQPNPNQPVSTPNDLLPFAVLPYVTFSGQYGEFFLNICRGPPEDIIHFLTLMSSKMTLFLKIEHFTLM